MRRAIVHIGMPRTGTTTLQRILSKLRGRLLARGVLYPELTPESADAPHLSHQHLGEALDGRRPRHEQSELLDALAGQLRGRDVDTVLISYESLVLARPRLAVPARLAAFFAQHGYAMEVVVTVKPQSEYLNSMYTWRTQFLREGRGFARYAGAARSSPKLRYGELVAPWSRAAGGRVAAVPVRDRDDDAPLVTRVLRAMSIADRAVDLIDARDLCLVENRSPGPLTVEASRRLAGASMRGNGVARDATRLIECSARQSGLDTQAFQGVSTPARIALADHFRERNDRFAAQAWGGRWSDRVADEPFRDVNEICGTAVPAAVAAQLDALVAEAVGNGVCPAGHVRRLWLSVAARIAPSA